VEVRFGVDGLVNAADCRWSTAGIPWRARVNVPAQNVEILRTGADDGARVEVRFGVGGLSTAAGCVWSTDFVTDSRTGTDGRRAGGSPLRGGGGCPCGGVWSSAGVSVGENHPRMKPRIREWTMCRWESLRGGGGCPCGGVWVSAGVLVGWGKTVHE
jgi:hypothetical protein